MSLPMTCSCGETKQHAISNQNKRSAALRKRFHHWVAEVKKTVTHMKNIRVVFQKREETRQMTYKASGFSFITGVSFENPHNPSLPFI
jgi:hypothetical protein